MFGISGSTQATVWVVKPFNENFVLAIYDKEEPAKKLAEQEGVNYEERKAIRWDEEWYLLAKEYGPFQLGVTTLDKMTPGEQEKLRIGAREKLKNGTLETLTFQEKAALNLL